MIIHTYVEQCLEQLSIRRCEADVHFNELNSVNLISAGLTKIGRVGVEHHTAVAGRTLHHGILTHTQYVATKVLHLYFDSALHVL